jgi:hypothetical protein
MKSLRALFVGLALFALAPSAYSQANNNARNAARSAGRRFTPSAGRNRLLQALRSANAPHYERTMPNGATRVYSHISDRHLPAMEQALDADSNVLEILHIGKEGANHTLALFARKLLHTQYSQAGHWRLRTWGNRLYTPGHPLYSAQIQLSKSEGDRLRGLLAAAEAEQGNEWNAGPNWENGHISVSLGKRSINCVSTWSEMPVGDNGEPLYQLLGLPYSYSGNPHGFQKALETQANERVIGVSVYAHQSPGFGADHNQDLFRGL